ncbi:hypothetical protein XENTR_v10022519 [Xenopus tropicalis]|uniref:Major histocompatibility complex class I-related gene protein n=1 Tax=Xenopus tropicalis TaxID=8364 RepID=A0A8J0R7H6_XENTR|nr:major histocompatibility complex class I-related gene protein [Xenopus tropicalis]KAE8588409.1 hypothetical protein XENTR_v10022519 [Xenopus tropicalis]|eukprot:XP_004918993.1 PREDICTED: major histocompatibility complex class I-related gene protein-like [Xenopus tropicalis]
MACYISLVFLLGFPAVYSGSHSLHYYISMLSAPAHEVPQYSIVVYADGLPIGRYNSDLHRAQFLIPSLNVLTEHLELQTKFAQRWQVYQERKMAFLMGFLNRTSDRGTIHIYQRKFSCELEEDGTIGGYQEFALDGREVITFDRENEVFVPATQEAVTMLPRWNQYLGNAKGNKMYMENECIEHIKLYLPLIMMDLEKKVKPKVKVSISESDSGVELHCRVYGFYPRDVEVKWIKNGRDEIHSEEAAQILPNPDGTYQIRVSVGVTPEGGATYSCHIDHSSLEKALVVPFEGETKGYVIYIVIGVVVAALLALCLGLFIQRKMNGFKGSRQSVSTDEQD